MLAVAFDVGGTLYIAPDFDAVVEDQAYASLAAARTCSIADAKEMLRAQQKANYEQSGDTSKVRALEALGVSREAFQEAAAELDPAPFLANAPPIGSLLVGLTERGIKIGVLSNFKERLVRKVFGCLSADWDMVDASICVDDGLPIKPNLAPFRVLCKRLGVAPDRTVFVGDSVAKDLTPAKRLGMATVLVARAGGGEQDRSIVDYWVDSADAVIDLVGS